MLNRLFEILSIEEQPFARMRYINAGKRGKRVSSILPMFHGKVRALPEGIDACIVTSDLQGVVSSWQTGANVLLGEALVDELLRLAEAGELPYPERTGIVLAGDLYSAPCGTVRGATGDVRVVWHAFASHYAWTVGVQGNHDTFGTPSEAAKFERTEGMTLLDTSFVEHGGVQFGGVGKIIGLPSKAGRRSESEFMAALDLVLDERPDVLVLHQGPDGIRDSGGRREKRGHAGVRHQIESKATAPLIICGHVHWEQPLAELRNGAQVLNVDARVVVLTT